jgi:hypothetical protein
MVSSSASARLTRRSSFAVASATTRFSRSIARRDQLQAFGDSTVDQTNVAEIERFCERVAERTGGEFVLVVNELMVVPGLASVEQLMLAHYSGGTGVAGASARVNREPGQVPTLSEWQDTPG